MDEHRNMDKSANGGFAEEGRGSRQMETVRLRAANPRSEDGRRQHQTKTEYQLRWAINARDPYLNFLKTASRLTRLGRK